MAVTLRGRARSLLQMRRTLTRSFHYLGKCNGSTSVHWCFQGVSCSEMYSTNLSETLDSCMPSCRPLLPRVLKKIRTDRAHVILEPVHWEQKEWYPELQGLSICSQAGLPSLGGHAVTATGQGSAPGPSHSPSP